MSMSSGRTVSSSGEPPLDARLCAEVGAELARVRVSRGLTEAQVGERLLLSTRQVKALETVELEAFHNAAFYVNALRKYAQFAAVDPALVARVADSMVREVTPLSDGSSAPLGRDDLSSRGQRAVVGVVAAVMAVGALVAAGSYLVRARRAGQRPLVTAAAVSPLPMSGASQSASAPPEARRQVTPAPDAPANAAPSEPTPSVPTTTGFGSLRVPRSTWIFLRDADNVVTERSLAAGESIDLETQPTYLAVGVPDAELRVGAHQVDLSPFVSNGQIRLRAGDLDALVQGASPIEAPTPVGRTR